MLLKDVLAVKCEIEFLSFYKNQPLFPEIVTFMDTHGFTLNSISHGINKQRRIGMEPVWDDCLFIKKEREDTERMKAVLQVFGLD